MTNIETHSNKTIFHAILGMVAVLLICGVLCGAAAGGAWQNAINAASPGDTVDAPCDTKENIIINQNITLNLNGHTIKADDDDKATIEISGGATVTITGNGVITGGNSGVWVKTGTLTLNGGTIKENDASVHGGGVCLGLQGDKATFYMNGGTITENWTGRGGGQGGGVYVGEGCEFVQTGGEITRNDVHISGYGGGVYVAKTGTFTMDGGNITGKGTKTGDTYTVAEQGAGVYVAGGTFIMKKGTISECKADSNGGGVYVTAGGSFTMSDGTITENAATDTHVSAYGGGVCVSSGTFTMDGGNITKNKASGSGSAHGGGVCVSSDGSFTMSNGAITKNTASWGGGGVYVAGTFTMKDGVIEGFGMDGQDAAVMGGGVYVDYSGTFTMEKGKITQCKAGYDGGGVYVAGEFKMEDGYITNNSTTFTSSVWGRGGGVCVWDGYFTLWGGEISNNKAKVGGGGVSTQGGHFWMKGGIITQCTATEEGGGVLVRDGKIFSSTTSNSNGGFDAYDDGSFTDFEGSFTMEGGIIDRCTAETGGGVCITTASVAITGGEITGNIATGDGGGVHVWEHGIFTISGKPVIRNNTKGGSANNVVLEGTDCLMLTGSLTGGEIMITMVGDKRPRSDAVFGTAEADASGAERIVADDEKNIGKIENGSLKWTRGTPLPRVADVIINGVIHSFWDFEAAWSFALNNHDADKVTVKLFSDVDPSHTLEIPENSDDGSFTIDLNGKTMRGNGTGSVISVSEGGKLILTDSSSAKTGKITGGNAENGGGVYVDGGTFTMEGGNITENTASLNGGGVYVQGGEFTMRGGSITENTANQNGGGVYVQGGEFTLRGGSITGNTATKNGGGVYNNSVFYLSEKSNGMISGNTAENGGGVYNTSKFQMAGGSITKNTANNGGGVYYVPQGNEAFNMFSGSITGNTATWNGGGVFVASGMFTMYDGTIDKNTAVGTDAVESGSGGGVFVDAGTFTMKGGTICENKVLKNLSSGGGVFVWKTGTFTMDGNGTTVVPAQITRNSSAGYGGGVMVYNGGKFTLSVGVIGSSNAASGANTAAYGAGVCVENGDFKMTGGTVGYNHSSVYFGGVSFYNDDTTTHHTFDMSGGIIKANSSDWEKTAVTGAQGVAIGCSEAARSHTFFTMSGTASIPDSNSLYLANNLFITVPGEFASGTSSGAKSILFDEHEQTSVVVAVADSAEIAASALSHFTLHSHYAGYELKTASDNQKQIVAEITETVTVTFKSNGGSSVEPQTILKWGKATKPEDPIRENYQFAGWYTDNDTFYNKYDFDTPVTENLTLYAKWDFKNLQVYYSENGAPEGTAPTDSKWYAAGDTVIILQPPAEMVYAEHSFVCWNTRADGQGTDYAAGSSLTMPDNDLTLYAKWEDKKETYTLRYAANGAESGTVPTDQQGTAGSQLSVSDNTGNLAKTGYTFSGWNTRADGEGTNYAAGSQLTMPARDLTLYAKWTENEHTYTIKFDANGGTGTMEDKTACLYNTDITLPDNTFTRTGYTFSGWIDPTSPFKPIPDKGTVNFREDQVTGGVVTLKALWTANTCTVSFYKEKDDHNPYLTRQVSYGLPIEKPDDPEKPGYTFDRWYNKANNTEWDFATPLTVEYLGLYATWTSLPPHTITIHDSKGGVVYADPEEAVQDTAISLTVYPDSGYQLTNLRAEPEVDIDMMNLTFIMPGVDVDIYPVFELIPSPSPVPSHSSESQGSSTWLTETPTPTPTPTPVSDVPTVKPLPTPSGATPAPFAGVLAGLGAALAVFGLRRK